MHFPWLLLVGYKCLDPVFNQLYLSRHVVFDGHSFPAKDQVPSHLPSKISVVGDVPFTLPVSSFIPQTDQLLVYVIPSTSTSPTSFASSNIKAIISEPSTEAAPSLHPLPLPYHPYYHLNLHGVLT